MPLPQDQRNALNEAVIQYIRALPRFRRRDLANRLALPPGTDLYGYPAIEALSDDVILDLAENFEVIRPADALWPDVGLRLFVSHVAEVRGDFGALRAQLSKYGMNFFLAHDNIEGGAEWRHALATALDTMDAMLTIHSQGFSASVWTNQEIGYGVARKVPILPIMRGEAPHGFVAHIQGYRYGDGQEAALVDQLLQRLNVDIPDKLGEALARQLKFANAFAHADLLATPLTNSNHITPAAAKNIRLALRFNDQVYNSGNGDRLNALLGRFGL